MTKNKDFKIEFAPGCFDHFEGSQEELDQLMNEIKSMFEGKSQEEIEAMSQPIDDESFDELPDDVKLQLIRSFEDDVDNKRNLQ